MKKKLMTLQQHRLLKEAGRLIAFSEKAENTHKKETTGRNREEREEKCRRSAKSRKRRGCGDPRGKAPRAGGRRGRVRPCDRGRRARPLRLLRRGHDVGSLAYRGRAPLAAWREGPFVSEASGGEEGTPRGGGAYTAAAAFLPARRPKLRAVARLMPATTTG
mgnify:CR=1 FL=1